MTNNDTFAKRLIQRRAEQGYSQEELSKMSGIAAAQISRYEAGRNKPRANIIAKLAETLEVPFSWLAYGDTSEVFSILNEQDKHEYLLYIPPPLRHYLIEQAKEEGIPIEEYIVNTLVKVYELKTKKKNNL